MIRNINVKWFKNRTKRIKLMAISLATIIGFSVSTATVFKVSARADEGSYYVEIYDNEGNTIDENNQNIEVAVDDSSMMTSSTATPIQPQEDTASTANLEMYNQQINFNGVDTSAFRNLLSASY